MNQTNRLPEELLRQSGLAGQQSVEAHLRRIDKMIRSEKRKVLQMKWICALLWLGTFVVAYLQVRPAGVVASDDQVSATALYLSIAAGFLPMAAGVSTLLLLFRLWGSSRKEANLRLSAIETQLSELRETMETRERTP